MKIIGLSASPHKKGNTAWVVGKILEGAEEKGAKTKVWSSGDIDIKPCKGCNACQKGDRGCTIKDDMQKIYKAIENSDAIVLGSPVYMGQMSGQAKLFTDRLYAVLFSKFAPRFKEDDKKKKLVIIFTQEDPDESLYREYFEYTKRQFQLMGLDVQDIHVIADTGKEPASEKKGLKAAMKEVGASL